MRHPPVGKSFTFVNYDGPQLPQNPNLRRLMRQQAMRRVAVARKQKGDYGQHNLGQCPPMPDREHLVFNLPLERGAVSGNARSPHTRDPTLSELEWAKDLKRLSNNSSFYYQHDDIPRILMTFPGLGMSENFP